MSLRLLQNFISRDHWTPLKWTLISCHWTRVAKEERGNMVTEAKLEPLNQLFLFTKHPVDLKHRRTQNIHRGLFVVVLAEDLEAQISLCQWTHCGVQLTKGPLPCGDSLISQRVTLFTVNTPPRQAVLSCIFATCTFSHRNHKEGLKPHKYAIF